MRTTISLLIVLIITSAIIATQYVDRLILSVEASEAKISNANCLIELTKYKMFHMKLNKAKPNYESWSISQETF
jgi:hypothetical protein